MNAKSAQVLQDALQLPREDRIHLVEELIATLSGQALGEPDDEDEWNAELDRRLEATHAGEPGTPASVVHARILRKLDGR